MTVIPLKRRKDLNAKGALVHLAKIAETHPDKVVEADSVTHLGGLLGWTQPRTSKQLKAWKSSGQVAIDRHDQTGKLLVRVMPDRTGMTRSGTPSEGTAMPKGAARRAGHAVPHPAIRHAVARAAAYAGGHAEGHAEPDHSTHNTPADSPEKSKGKSERVEPAGSQKMQQNDASSSMPASRPSGMAQTMPLSMPATAGRHALTPHVERLDWHLQHGDGGGGGDAPRSRHAPFVVVAAYLTALALALIAAWFSVRGMIVLFPGDPGSAMALGIGLEAGKIVTAAFLAGFWGRLAWLFRLALIVLVFGCEILNASGVFGQLVIAHLHKGAVAEATFERTDAAAAARIEVAQGRMADLDQRIATIDGAVEGAAKRGNAKTAMAAMEAQKKQRATLAGEREQARRDLADLRANRASGSAQRKVDEAESAPVVWAARTVGIDRDPEVIIRSIIALIVICLDPLAVLLMAAVNSGSARRREAY
jgi:hypothetical protein